MKLSFTRHARARIVERRISLYRLRETLKYPDFIKPIFGEKILVRKRWGSEILEIVCVKKENYVRIITVYAYEN